jgi:hypothetical protein
LLIPHSHNGQACHLRRHHLRRYLVAAAPLAGAVPLDDANGGKPQVTDTSDATLRASVDNILVGTDVGAIANSYSFGNTLISDRVYLLKPFTLNRHPET